MPSQDLDTSSLSSKKPNQVVDFNSLFTRLINMGAARDGDFQLRNISLLISNSDAQRSSTTAHFSFLCANPCEQKQFVQQEHLDAWILARDLPTYHEPVLPEVTTNIPFHCGWVGYFSYPGSPTLAEFNYYPWAICFDHQQNTFQLLGKPDDSARNAFAWLLQQLSSHGVSHGVEAAITTQKHGYDSTPFKAATFIPKWSKHDYAKAFARVRNYLLAGDCYQINLTQPFISSHYSGPASATLQPLFSALKPNFGCYFQGQECELVSVSPERFMSINKDGKLEAKPIKGTIKRSDDALRDETLVNELVNSEKNRAENLMIVDLLRNDLSMSAVPGSVQVDKLFALESHPNVHHLVSTISAQLKPNCSLGKAINNAFPGGSITGAPKKRAMEIITELEVQPRSLYCGSFGYFSDSGYSDFNILIRSLEFRDNTITCWGGGGITIDSECDDEYDESVTKIRRIMDVIEAL